MEENTETTIVSPIETALAKENVTNQVIQKLKENYLGLKINGLEDKKGFKAVEDARKECKSIRTLAVRICKKGREDAIQIQKDWIAKEKEVVAEIEIVEGYLESESNKIKELQAKILFEAAQKEKLPARKEKLSLIGYEVEDAELLKIDDNQYDALYNDFYKKHLEAEAEKLRIENERIAAQKAEEERLKKEEADRIAAEEKKKIEAENARLKAEAEAKEKQLAAERAEAAKKQAEKDALIKKRSEELRPYIVLIRDYNGLINSDEEAYQKQLSDIKRGEEERIAFEKEQQAIVWAKMDARKKEAEKFLLQNGYAKTEGGMSALKYSHFIGENHYGLTDDDVELEQFKKGVLKQIELEKEKAEIANQKAENERIAAELKAKQEAEVKAKAEAEAKEKERIAAEKKAAKAPIKEQLIIWMNSCELMPAPSIKNEEAQAKVSEILLKYARFKKWANEQIESL